MLPTLCKKGIERAETLVLKQLLQFEIFISRFDVSEYTKLQKAIQHDKPQAKNYQLLPKKIQWIYGEPKCWL